MNMQYPIPCTLGHSPPHQAIIYADVKTWLKAKITDIYIYNIPGAKVLPIKQSCVMIVKTWLIADTSDTQELLYKTQA